MKVFSLYQGPLLQKKMNLTPVCIHEFTYHKMWDEITYPFPNIDGAPLMFGKGYVISFHT